MSAPPKTVSGSGRVPHVRPSVHGPKKKFFECFHYMRDDSRRSLLCTRSRTSRMILMCQSSRGFDLQLRARMVALLFQQPPQLRMDTEGRRIRRLVRRIEIHP
jgi:hypothetical protein